jgi:hypothetical protein
MALTELGDIATKYEDSFQFLQARKMRQANQLKLLVNLQRGDQNIASTLLLTLFNRVMAALYDDKIQVKFLPSQGITQDQLNSYNVLAQSDYLEMGKAKLDYDWIWDTLFFGRGYMETLRFNKKKKIMEPCVLNPLAFGYDPIVSEPQQWRYYWKWITKTKYELDKLIKGGKLKISNTDEIASGVEDKLWEYKQIVDQARDGVMPSSEPFSKDVFQILEFFGYNDKGERCVKWVDKNFATLVMEEVLKLDDDVDELGNVGSKWPIVVKEGYRQPHSSIPFSIADLLDDKHRAKSVLLNLAFIAAKDEANPVYLYNTEKVDDVTQFLSRQVNQHIPVSDVEMAVAPLRKAAAMSPELLNFITTLTQEANEPIGTGTALQPDKGSGSETATEVAIEQQLNDLAQSLLSKVLQFGESEFWSHWFHRYANNAEELGTKMANIVGVKGVDSTEVQLADFQTEYPPGVMVYSAKEAEYKELVLRRDLMQLYPVLAQTVEPDSLRNFNKHVLFPKLLQDPSLIEALFPKTMDEIKAEAENGQLQKEQMPDVADTDDHLSHIYTHLTVQPKTKAVWYHIAWHQEMLAEQKKQEQQQQAQQAQGALGGKGTVGKEKQSPLASASPLKTEIKNV